MRAGTDLVVPTGTGQITPQQARDSYLPASARELIVKGVPANTLRSYSAAWRPFRLWCQNRQRGFAPVSENTMISYLDEWRGRPMHHNRCKCRHHRPAPSTMWLWYAAVRFYHRVGSPPLPWECGENLTRAMIGYSLEMVESGWTPARAPRAFPTDVTRMVDALDLSEPKYLRDRAIILTNFYTAGRSADLGTYRLADVEHFPRGIRLVLRMSKTNRRPGKKIESREVFENSLRPQYCGVEAIHAWTDWLRCQGVTSGALFRPFSKPHYKAGERKAGVLLRGHRDGEAYRMDGTSLSEVIQDAAIRAELPNAEQYTCHSLRRGRATQQRELGGDPLDIARAYGWAPNGAINVYLEEAEREAPTAVGAQGLL